MCPWYRNEAPVGKLAQLAAVKTARVEAFVYIPPAAAFGAGRILVKPNLGYAAPPPAVVSLPVLAAVLRGLRRAAPAARIVIIEGVCSDRPLLEIAEKHGLHTIMDDNTLVGDAETLTMQEYPNRLPQPVKYASMTAPAYLADFDCVISVGAFKRTLLHGQPLISAALKNLYGLFPRQVYRGRSPHARGQLHVPSVPEVLKDIYFCIGQHIDGAVVDLTAKYVSPDERPDRVREVAVPVGQVVWGDDLLAVDETACRVAGEPVPDYIGQIRRLQQTLS